MTTVAWRDGVLAADKKGSVGNTGYRVTKLFKAKGHAIGFAGNQGVGLKFVDWWRAGKPGKCPLDDESEALVMDLATGRCYHYEEDGHPIPVEDKFASIGTGSDFAIGAMAAGATAVEAVKIASKWDNCSGLGINSFKCEPHEAGGE
jgi:20S proteasome alpha/beta subunit